ncbi:putative glucosidase II beta subunit-like protein [Lyophyllum shimeji]|uniref:Protein OS-9 homolog n=1 Tax=Lyophyllum shimeji TaxID=47721 RepID=A0A9P3UL49_LYOSH|nr:putative glucosidase II beta subunit-like protein [Lyophyllum shimeji]
MHLLALAAALVAPAHAARFLHSLPEDTYAFPKFRVAFLNNLPVLNETAERWLTEGLRGGELEFLDQPWSGHSHTSTSPKEIDSGDVHDGVSKSQVPESSPSAANYTLEKMKMGPKDSYLCLIPKPADNVTQVPDDQESNFELIPSRSWSLLQPLSGTCLYHRQGWFTYSYCHNEEIRQFKEATNSAGGHSPPQEDPDWEAYTLGKAPKPGADLTVAEQNAQAANLELARSAGSRYLVQRWGDGTVCDKTGRSREVEVQFHCSMTMTDHILFVKEAKTCSYVLVINTPRLCGEPGFKSRRDTGEEFSIRCREIVDTLSPPGTTDAPAQIPDSDYPVKLTRHKPVLPAPAANDAQVKMEGVDIKDSPYGELLRKTLEALMGGKDAKAVTLEEFADKDGVTFEIVEEIDLTDGQHEAVDRLAETLRAAGYDIKAKADKAVAGNNKDGEKEQSQAQRNRKAKAPTWHEEL